ncbi:hypothetical protein WOLCODRAFT_28243 [Wolfiporia cocos MD-104 SS10]|uniref:Uncharacterized protein n=1 Tax=Wolfiporia cocos (strain MD-104) TaxID=742152 RepID=A0A2H3JJ06_WOLCO|nr:hypothetical protein WOLCODRAFT_28243 [Wolfiporia cocos MD-104 SS10]
MATVLVSLRRYPTFARVLWTGTLGPYAFVPPADDPPPAAPGISLIQPLASGVGTYVSRENCIRRLPVCGILNFQWVAVPSEFFSAISRPLSGSTIPAQK